jgi:hypothetical protein
MAAKNPSKNKVGKSDSEKAAKFIELAEKRTGRILQGIKNLGNLSGSGYVSTPDQVSKIFQAIGDASQASYARFTTKGAKASGGFKL